MVGWVWFLRALTLSREAHQPPAHFNDSGDTSDEELEAACIWEYARESATITEAEFQHYLLRQKQKLKRERASMKEEDIIEEEEFLAAMSHDDPDERAKHDDFLQRFYKCDLAYNSLYWTIRKYGGALADPWPNLPQEVRSKLSAQARHSNSFAGLQPAWRGEMKLLWDLNAFDENEDEDYSGAWERVQPFICKHDHEIEVPGNTIAAFSIDFRRYSDHQILDDFTKWLTENRPASCPQPTRRGQKLRDHRVALERLGLMRLLHYHTPNQMRLQVPGAWRLYGTKAENFRKEVNAAIKWFKKSFPFLPENEMPNSARRKGAQKPKKQHSH